MAHTGQRRSRSWELSTSSDACGDPTRSLLRGGDRLPVRQSKERSCRFPGSRSRGTVYVPNATTGVNTVLRSLDFREGDEILVTDHVYNACNNAALYVSKKTGAKVVTVHIPFPVESPSVITERVLEAVTPRTRLVLIDHVTSPTALIYPVEEINPGAGAPGDRGPGGRRSRARDAAA
jgi:isopenicillin-N epimerase